MAERVSATFESERDAERAVEALIAAGLNVEAVTLVSPAGPEGGSATADETVSSQGEHPEDDLSTGMATGALLGLGAVNAGAGMGGVGSAATSQPLAAGAGGLAAGAIAGGLVGAAYAGLVHLGLAADTARLYHRRLQAGSSIVVAHPDGITPEEARAILEAHGGADPRGGEPIVPPA
jgi:hypothetical protein